MKRTLTVTYQKSTAQKHVYGNEEFPGVYIPKDFFDSKENQTPPSELTLTLATKEG